MAIKVGVHVSMHHSRRTQLDLGADVVQICLGSPQRWGQTKTPKGVPGSPLFVHAPYLINLSSADPEVLRKSRQTLWQQTLVAGEIGALGVVVHGGSWKKLSSQGKALDQWEKTFGRPFHTKVLIENSASGAHSLTRYLDDLEKLWDVLGDVRKAYGDVGFCLDTCHLWSSNMGSATKWEFEDPTPLVKSILSIVGKIDLVHANGSKTEYGSGKDQHSPLYTSVIPEEWMRSVILASGAEYAIAETTDPVADLVDLRRLLA